MQTRCLYKQQLTTISVHELHAILGSTLDLPCGEPRCQVVLQVVVCQLDDLFVIGAIWLQISMAILVHDIPRTMVTIALTGLLVHDCILGEMGCLLTVTSLPLHHIGSRLALFDGGLGALPRVAFLRLWLVPCRDYLVLWQGVGGRCCDGVSILNCLVGHVLRYKNLIYLGHSRVGAKQNLVLGRLRALQRELRWLDLGYLLGNWEIGSLFRHVLVHLFLEFRSKLVWILPLE